MLINKQTQKPRVFSNMYIFIYLSIDGTHVTANNSTNNKMFIFVSDLKMIYINNY